MSTPLRVLIVEDSPAEAAAMAHELERGGYNVTYERVETAEALQAALATRAWDVVLCDYYLPAFDGRAALALVQESQLDIPFILVSGKIGEELAVAMMKAGAHDYVDKRNLQRLVPAVERELKQAEVRLERRQALNMLRESEITYRTLLEQIPATTYIAALDETRSMHFVSPQAVEMFGVAPDEWTADPQAWLDYLHPDDRDQVLAQIARTCATREPFVMDYRLHTRNGHQVWVRDSAVVVWDELARAWRIKGVMLDITQRMEAQAVIERQLDMLGTLYAAAQKLSHSLDPQYVAQDIASSSVIALGASLAWLGVADPDGSIRPLACYPKQSDCGDQLTARWDETTPEGRGAIGHAIRTGYPVIVNDIATDRRFAPWRQQALAQGFRSSVAIPLVSYDKPFGVLCLFSDRPDLFTPEQVDFYQSYVHLTAAALESSRLFHQVQRHAAELEQRVRERTAELEAANEELEKSRAALQELAIRDPLTGLFNRREMNRLLSEEVERVRRYGPEHSVSFVMLDIDHFKLVNDTYGHPVGDQVLKALAELLQGTLRMLDRPARFGGEEFAIIVPEQTADKAASLAERLRGLVAAHPFVVDLDDERAAELSITISLGVASCPADAESAERLVVAADQALYEAKRRGRNRVVLFREIGTE